MIRPQPSSTLFPYTTLFRSRAKPRLSVKLAPGEAGPRTVHVSYLAHGFEWSADYIARLNEGGNRMDLTGWATLTNRTDTAFSQAEVQLVAGTLNILAAADGGSRSPAPDWDYGASASGAVDLSLIPSSRPDGNTPSDAQGIALLSG